MLQGCNGSDENWLLAVLFLVRQSTGIDIQYPSDKKINLCASVHICHSKLILSLHFFPIVYVKGIIP